MSAYREANTYRASATGATASAANSAQSIMVRWGSTSPSTPPCRSRLLKPITDGLDPVLGVDPSVTLEFTPTMDDDDRVQSLRIHRQAHPPCPIVLAAGPTRR
jgi:hypothetical protein